MRGAHFPSRRHTLVQLIAHVPGRGNSASRDKEKRVRSQGTERASGKGTRGVQRPSRGADVATRRDFRIARGRNPRPKKGDPARFYGDTIARTRVIPSRRDRKSDARKNWPQSTRAKPQRHKAAHIHRHTYTRTWRIP